MRANEDESNSEGLTLSKTQAEVSWPFYVANFLLGIKLLLVCKDSW